MYLSLPPSFSVLLSCKLQTSGKIIGVTTCIRPVRNGYSARAPRESRKFSFPVLPCPPLSYSAPFFPFHPRLYIISCFSHTPRSPTRTRPVLIPPPWLPHSYILLNPGVVTCPWKVRGARPRPLRHAHAHALRRSTRLTRPRPAIACSAPRFAPYRLVRLCGTHVLRRLP